MNNRRLAVDPYEIKVRQQIAIVCAVSLVAGFVIGMQIGSWL